MPQFVIERQIPEIGSADREALKGAATKSNEVLAAMTAEGKTIQWLQSYVTDNKIFCGSSLNRVGNVHLRAVSG